MAECNKQKTDALRPVTRIRKRSSNSHNSNSKLHPREVMLIRRLLVWGWSEERIWQEYRIPIPVIQKAKKKIERQVFEEFNNKEMLAFELAKLKDRLMFIIDSNEAIARDKNVSLADRLKSEAIKIDALAILQKATEASITSPNPRSALKKIAEASYRREQCNSQ